MAVAGHRDDTRTHAYIDDNAAAAVPKVSQKQYEGLLGTYYDLGLQVAASKCQAPSTFML